MPRAATEDDIRRIYRETIDDLYGFVSRRCDGNRDLAEDVAQDTWLRAVRAWSVDGVPDRPLGWLTTVAARLLSNHRRRPYTDHLDAAAEPAVDADDTMIDDSENRQSMLHRALARLPMPQSRLLHAFHFEKQPVGDIAAAAGLTERAVEGRLRRARQNLRREVEADLATEREGEKR